MIGQSRGSAYRQFGSHRTASPGWSSGIEGERIATVRVMFGGLMYVLRADALEVERGDSPDLSSIYAPGTRARHAAD